MEDLTLNKKLAKEELVTVKDEITQKKEVVAEIEGQLQEKEKGLNLP